MESLQVIRVDKMNKVLLILFLYIVLTTSVYADGVGDDVGIDSIRTEGSSDSYIVTMDIGSIKVDSGDEVVTTTSPSSSSSTKKSSSTGGAIPYIPKEDTANTNTKKESFSLENELKIRLNETKILEIFFEDKIIELNITLIENDSIHLIYNNQTIVVSFSESEIDIDNDGSPDLEISIDSKNSLSPMLNIKKIPAARVNDVEMKESNNAPEVNQLPSEPFIKFNKNFLLYGLIGIIILIVLLTGFLILFLNTKKKKSRSFILSPQKESELLEFISKARSDGFTDAQIKSRLKESGWSKKTIDDEFKKL